MKHIYQLTIAALLLVIVGLVVVPSATADDDATYDISARMQFNDAQWEDGEWHSTDCTIYRMEFDRND